MMDFMESLKRGVDKAGFEVDRLLRANRVRSRINAVRSQMDEEERRIGRRVVELYLAGGLVQEELRESCDRVKRLKDEVAQAEAELETINREGPVEGEAEGGSGPRPVPASCSGCGAPLPEDALFCSKCGTRVAASTAARAAGQEPGAPGTGPGEPPAAQEGS